MSAQAITLKNRLLRHFKRYEAETRNDSFGNPVSRMSSRLGRELRAEKVTLSELKALVRHLSDEACLRRIKALRHTVGHTGDPNLPKERLHALLERVGTDFDRFCDFWGTPRTGIVLTAHPTFALSHAARHTMATIALMDDDARIMDCLAHIKHAPSRDEKITLHNEHAEAMETLARIEETLEWVGEEVLQFAKQRWANHWSQYRKKLVICPLTTASWVGYDLDGRTDISWASMVYLRLHEKSIALNGLLEKITAIEPLIKNQPTPVRTALISLYQQLSIARDEAEDVADAFAPDNYYDGEDNSISLAKIANRLSNPDTKGRLTSVQELIRSMDTCIAHIEEKTPEDAALTRRLILLKSRLKGTGLGTGHLHFRLNALQMHNGFRRLLQATDQGKSQSQYRLDQIERLLHKAPPLAVNFLSLAEENATAIRLFILIAQILKHIDVDAPIRFLIAECEDAQTVLMALYMARVFGIADKVDISPLFETSTALERGDRIIEQLMTLRSWQDYVQTRGRLSIQTGFSDAGRFMGQIPATLAVERLQMKIAKLVHHTDPKVPKVLFFNTHGESMGRGAFPGNMNERLNYVLSPGVRRRFAHAKVGLIHETSFQGGDGFLLFANPPLAQAAIIGIMENACTIPTPHDDQEAKQIADDALYRDNSLSLNLFLQIKNWQEELFERWDYQQTLDCFQVNLLYDTGSRRAQRQHESVQTSVKPLDARQRRAIPHNAILQQLGAIPHVFGGMGQAIMGEEEHILTMLRESPRLKMLLSLAIRARSLSNLYVMMAYGRMTDPTYWMARAERREHSPRRNEMRRLSRALENDTRARAVYRLMTHLRDDSIDLDTLIKHKDTAAAKEALAPPNRQDEEDARALMLLHAVRLSLIEQMMIIGAGIPPFAPRIDYSFDTALQEILRLNVPSLLRQMEQVFPQHSAHVDTEVFDEAADYPQQDEAGYSDLWQNRFLPIGELYDVAREVSIGIAHHFRAWG